MRTSNIRVLALFGLIATLGPAAVKAESPAEFVIPFGFTVGTQSFAAGSYRVGEALPQVLRIQSDSGRAKMVILGIPGQPAKNSRGRVSLTFRKYGERYFLSGWAGTSRGLELPKSNAEKELIAKQAAAETSALIASSGN